MRKVIGVAIVAASAAGLTACGAATTVVHAPAPKPSVTQTGQAGHAPGPARTVTPRPTITKTVIRTASPAASAPAPATSAPAPATTHAASTPTTGPGYLGDIFPGGAGNPCNFASGYQYGVCNPTGETEQQYIEDPGGPAPGTSTNAQGCYYVKMGEGYCPSTNTYVPMKDPNG